MEPGSSAMAAAGRRSRGGGDSSLRFRPKPACFFSRLRVSPDDGFALSRMRFVEGDTSALARKPGDGVSVQPVADGLFTLHRLGWFAAGRATAQRRARDAQIPGAVGLVVSGGSGGFHRVAERARLGFCSAPWINTRY